MNGLKFKRQHSIGNYIVDFYCASKRLIIELDGEIHLSSEQDAKDQIRDKNLREMGFIVLRFTNDEIIARMDHVQKKILKIISGRE